MQIQIGGKAQSDFTDPIGMLGDCHRRIEGFLRVLVAVAGTAGGGTMNAEQRRAFENALNYFRDGAPKHTADEEESLFPRLRGRADAVLAVMATLEADHRQADELHGAVERLGRRWLQDDRLAGEDAERLVAALAQLEAIYGRHIRTEDSELFPAASAVLSDEERLAMGNEMRARRAGNPK